MTKTVAVEATLAAPPELSKQAQAASDAREDAAAGALALVHSGQRKINLVWELTQAAIAIVVTAAFVADHVMSRSLASSGLDAAFFLIVGFYFSRTNHTQIGGVGPKPKPAYEGR